MGTGISAVLQVFHSAFLDESDGSQGMWSVSQENFFCPFSMFVN